MVYCDDIMNMCCNADICLVIYALQPVLRELLKIWWIYGEYMPRCRLRGDLCSLKVTELYSSSWECRSGKRPGGGGRRAVCECHRAQRGMGNAVAEAGAQPSGHSGGRPQHRPVAHIAATPNTHPEKAGLKYCGTLSSSFILRVI